MPQPKRFYARTIWDRVAVDAAFDLLDGGNARNEAGEEVYEWKSTVEVSDTSTSTTPYVPRFAVAHEKWARNVPRFKISTKEKIALRSLIARGGTAHVSMMQKGAGGVALLMLSLRHYAILVDGDPNDFRTLVYQVTEAGRTAWNMIASDG